MRIIERKPFYIALHLLTHFLIISLSMSSLLFNTQVNYGTASTHQSDPTTRTQQPIVTGSSVIGIKYRGGVLLASDTLASYGSMARFKDVQRIVKLGDNVLIGASGEMSDFQAIQDMIENLFQEDLNQDDGYKKSPAEVFNYLRTILYQRRGKGNPLWNQLLVGGFHQGQSFLGYVDLIGTSYEENFIATGYGAYLAIPLIRERWHADMTEEEARTLLEECLRVLFYRDCRASNRIQIAKSSMDETSITKPYEISHNWETATYDARHNSKADGSSW